MQIYVAFYIDAIFEPSADGFRHEGRIEEWSIVSWGPKLHGRSCWESGKDKESFWQTLRTLADQNNSVTVWGWNVWPAWCVMNGVSEVSECRLTIDVSGDKPDDTFIAANPPTIITVHTPNGKKIKLIDLANYGIMPADYGITGPAGAMSATKLAVEAYHELCFRFRMGLPQSTAAAQAWWIYKNRHEPKLAAVPPSSPETSRLEEAAYFGGRCECKRMGTFTEEVYHLDITAMYTAIGNDALFPREYTGLWQPMEGRGPPWIEADQLMIADVTIETDEALYPCSDLCRVNNSRQPQPRDGEERVVYPVGKFRTALCGPELALAVGHDHIKEWHRVQYYEPFALMHDWSQWALQMRDAVKLETRALANCAKKIINSLPGKWGQRKKVWVDYLAGETSSDVWLQEWGRHPVTDAMTQFRTIAGKCQYLEREELTKEACPAVAGFWTSYGRVKLLLLTIIAGQENVYYMDTDGLLVNRIGYERLLLAGVIGTGPATNKAGYLRLVEKASDLVVQGIRRYHFNGKWTIAGESPEQFEHEGFGKQLWQGSAGRSAYITNKVLDRPPEYKHGLVVNGFVKPFRIEAKSC